MPGILKIILGIVLFTLLTFGFIFIEYLLSERKRKKESNVSKNSREIFNQPIKAIRIYRHEDIFKRENEVSCDYFHCMESNIGIYGKYLNTYFGSNQKMLKLKKDGKFELLLLVKCIDFTGCMKVECTADDKFNLRLKLQEKYGFLFALFFNYISGLLSFDDTNFEVAGDVAYISFLKEKLCLQRQQPLLLIDHQMEINSTNKKSPEKKSADIDNLSFLALIWV